MINGARRLDCVWSSDRSKHAGISGEVSACKHVKWLSLVRRQLGRVVRPNKTEAGECLRVHGYLKSVISLC
jgi:hypothetical protein